MKSIACYALHYGSDYLAWSIRSVQDAVDEVHIFYSELASFGFYGGAVNPDTQEMLHKEAHRFAKKPIFWHNVTGVNGEGAHRNLFYNACNQSNADILVVVDADEVWDTEALRFTIESVWKANAASRWLTNFANFWQSWKWQVLDHFKPIRFVDLRHTPGPGLHTSKPDEYLTEAQQPLPVYHFGYAQRAEIMRYKWTCHGHQAELRPGWVQSKFIDWTPETTDLHPVVNNLWDKAHATEPSIMEKINEILHDHPYKGVELIR